MASHKVVLVQANSPGPFDVYYRNQNEFNFNLFISDVYDLDIAKGLCVTFPDTAVEVKMINKHLGANIEVIKPIPR